MNIQEMEAGREMDVAIAELMGWHYWDFEGDYMGEYPMFIVIDELLIVYDAANKHREFNPSTDIAVAWQVHQKACELPFSKRREYFKQLQDSVSRRKMPLDYKDMGSRISWPDVMAFLEPVDFCRAALKAVKK